MPESVDNVATEQREAAPTTTTEPVNRGFDFLSTEPLFQDDVTSNAITTTETKTETENPVTKTPEELAAEEAEKNEQTQTTEQTPGTESTETTENQTTTEEEGFVTDEELSGGNTETAEDGTWKALAMAEGLQVGEDFEESFEAYQALREADITSKIESAKQEAIQAVLSNMPPELAMAVELANSNPELSIQDILQPTLQIEAYLKLDDAALLRADIEAANPDWTTEMIDTEMQLIDEKGLIKHNADKIRVALNRDKTAIQENYNNKILAHKEQAERGKVIQKQEEVNRIKQALDRVPMFFDKKLTDKDKQFLNSKLDTGYLDELRQNPERLIKAMLYDQFGEKAQAYYKDRVRQEVLSELAKKQHNVPTTTGKTANVTVVTKPSTGNNFDALDKEFG